MWLNTSVYREIISWWLHQLFVNLPNNVYMFHQSEDMLFICFLQVGQGCPHGYSCLALRLGVRKSLKPCCKTSIASTPRVESYQKKNLGLRGGCFSLGHQTKWDMLRDLLHVFHIKFCRLTFCQQHCISNRHFSHGKPEQGLPSLEPLLVVELAAFLMATFYCFSVRKLGKVKKVLS